MPRHVLTGPGPGRPKGSKAKADLKREAAIKATGLTPLDYMLSKLRDETSSVEDRKWAAQSAAPYVHPRLSQIDARHSGQIDVRQWLQALGEPD